MDTLGEQLRLRRRRLQLTLDKLAAKTGISKPYLSLIETGRVPNPPADDKLRLLEKALQFTPGYLVSQAHWLRTPPDVRSAVQKLIGADKSAVPPQKRSKSSPAINLDHAYLSGLLHELADKNSPNVQPLSLQTMPVINKVAAGYPQDFTDLDYPRGSADEYVPSPDMGDPNAFAARVVGDSMAPQYRADDVVLFSPSAPPRSGDDCFVRLADGHTTFKRVYFEQSPDGRQSVRLQPLNPKYPPQVHPAEQVSGVYRAIFKYERLNTRSQPRPPKKKQRK